MNRILLVFTFFLGSIVSQGQEIALVKYSGGGDWYANPTALPNLIRFCNQNINTKISSKPVTVELSNASLYMYPYLHITGHGNIVLNDLEVQNLRKYLLGGGFLHIDDNYGLDQYIRREIKRVFPEYNFVQLPNDHVIFRAPFNFPGGIPKIHEHDNKPPQAFAIIHNNRIVCLYTYETDLSDGWEDPEVHNDPEHIRAIALKMGANIINYAFKN